MEARVDQIWKGGGLYKVGARVRGFWGLPEPRSRSGGSGRRVDLVGCRWANCDCVEDRGLRERRERESAARQLFPETENVRCLTDYNAAIVIRWGIKRSPNAMKLERRSIYTIIRPHANFQPILRTFFRPLIK